MGVDLNLICDKFQLFRYKQQLFKQFSLNRKREQDIPGHNCLEKIQNKSRNVSFYVNQRRYLRRCQLETVQRTGALDVRSNHVDKGDKEFIMVVKLETQKVVAVNDLEKEKKDLGKDIFI